MVWIDWHRNGVRADAFRRRGLLSRFEGSGRWFGPEHGEHWVFSGLALNLEKELVEAVAGFGEHSDTHGQDCFPHCCGLHMPALASYLQLH